MGRCRKILGLPYLSWSNIPKLGKIYQITTKYTKWPYYICNGCKIDQMVIKYLYQDFPYQDPPKFTQIWIFGLKTNHLATLPRCRVMPCRTEKILFRVDRPLSNWSLSVTGCDQLWPSSAARKRRPRPPREVRRSCARPQSCKQEEEPVIRLLNFQLQIQRWSRSERFFKQKKLSCLQNYLGYSSVVNFYSAGVITLQFCSLYFSQCFVGAHGRILI
jgi:hypothetical protein